MENQEYIMKLSMLQEEAKKLEEQMNIVNNQAGEFEILKMSLNNLNHGEILAGLGKGLYVKSEIKEKELFVSVGAGVVVKKSKDETEKIIDSQLVQMAELKDVLLHEIEKINIQMKFLIDVLQKSGDGEKD